MTPPWSSTIQDKEFSANTRGSPLGWHAGESDSRAVRSHPRGNVPHFSKSDEVPRMRTTVKDVAGLLPNPGHFPSYPPGFDNSRRSPPGIDNGYKNASGFDNNHRNRSGFDSNHINRSGLDNNHRNRSGLDNNHRNRSGFDNSHSFHGEIMFQESLEIASDRPFLPQRRAPPGGSTVSNSSDQIPRGDNQGMKVKLCGPSQSRPTSIAVKDCTAPEACEGSPSKLLASEKTKKMKKLGTEDAQLFERPSTTGTDYDRTTKVCHKLWKDLDFAIQQRERDLREKEERFTPSIINQEVLEEEKKQTAAMKNDIMEERRRLEEEAQRISKEKDAMERTSSELAVQMVELKQVQRQLEKEKAALLARKAELSAKGRCSLERDSVNATIDTPFVAVKAEIEEPVINPCRNCGKCTNCTSGSGAKPRNIQNQEPKSAMDVPPVARNRNLKPVKAKLVTSER